jgi:hypothetical protein
VLFIDANTSNIHGTEDMLAGTCGVSAKANKCLDSVHQSVTLGVRASAQRGNARQIM